MTLSKQDEFEFNLSINSYYCGEYSTGLRACEKLLNKNIPWHTENNVRCNQTYYLPKLSDHQDTTVIKFNTPLPGSGFSRFNPTIINYEDGFLIFIRHSNYEIVNGRYIIQDPKNVIHTKYSAVFLRPNLEIYKISFLINGEYEKSSFPADGIEDIRLYFEGGKLKGSGTIRNMMPHNDKAQIATVDIDLENNFIGVPNILPSPSESPRHEKNWMPILGDSCVSWLYACGEGGDTRKLELVNGAPRITSSRKAPAIARNFRGGSQLVKYGDNYLALTHEVCILNNGKRNYIHRFILFSLDFEILNYSLPFFLSNDRTVEFVAGLAIRDDFAYITYGHMDREAFLMKLPLENVFRTFSNRLEFMNENRNLRYF